MRHAPTSATRRGAFGRDEPLGEADRIAADAIRPYLPGDGSVISSPALRCRQTAAAAGMAPQVDAALAECRFGRWEGRTLAEVAAGEPDAVDGWMRDPDAAPHGGESLTVFIARVRAWLDGQAALPDGTTVAFTHSGVVRAAVISALRAPSTACWQLAADPLSISELHAHDGRWSVNRVNWPVPA